MSVVRSVVRNVVRGVVNPVDNRYGVGIPFLLTSTGNGTGVSTLTVTVSEDTTFTLNRSARFYSDAGGTLNESREWIATTGAPRTRYIKCPSGTADFIISGNTITSLDAWTSGANAASLGGDVSPLTALTTLMIGGSNTLSGDITGLTLLTQIDVQDSNTLSGSVAGLTLLIRLIVGGSNTLSGSVAGLTLLNFLSMTGNNTLSGDISGFDLSITVLEAFGNNTLSGDFSEYTLLQYLIVYGFNTVTGDLSLISSNLVSPRIGGNNQIVTYTAGGDWSSIPDQGNIFVIPGVGYGLSSAEVDLFIQEVESTRAVDRHLHLELTGSNAPRTGASDAAVAAIIADGGIVTTNP